MLFITPEQQYYSRSCAYPSAIDSLNELCLLNNMQREYAYKQQQILKRQIQKLNQPLVEFTQDVNNYYVVLTKVVNQMNYQVINSFNNYELRQIENTLIIKSTKDNFFKNITLPQNVDMTKDITYKITDNGYKMIVCISKEQLKYQIKTVTFGLPTLIDKTFGNNLRTESRKSEQNKPKFISDKSVTCGIKIPIVYDNKQTETTVQTCAAPKSTKITTNHPQVLDNPKKTSKSISISIEDNYKSAEENIEPLTGFSDSNMYVKSFTEDNQDLKSTRTVPEATKKVDDKLSERNIELSNANANTCLKNKDENPLKNYKTNERKTVFLPDTAFEYSNDNDASMRDVVATNQNDTGYIPVKRTLSPTLEDVVDQEFLEKVG